MIKIQSLKMFIDGDYIHLNNGEISYKLSVFDSSQVTEPRMYNQNAFPELQEVLRKYGYHFFKEISLFDKIKIYLRKLWKRMNYMKNRITGK